MSQEFPNATKCYSQITPSDVESQVSLCFRNEEHSHLKKENVSTITHFIKSRDRDINLLQCFIFLQNYCIQVCHTFDRNYMETLIDCIFRKVHECVTGLMLQRPMNGGKNSKKWDNKKIQDLFFYDSNDRFVGVKRALYGQQRYPLKLIKKLLITKEDYGFQYQQN